MGFGQREVDVARTRRSAKHARHGRRAGCDADDAPDDDDADACPSSRYPGFSGSSTTSCGGSTSPDGRLTLTRYRPGGTRNRTRYSSPFLISANSGGVLESSRLLSITV